MPVNPTYPGVYIQEVPSGVRTIVGVATSVTAFLGRAVRGPVDEPYLVTSWAEFERSFGGLHLDYPLSYAVKDFFVNGGQQALIVRLFKKAAGTDASGAGAPGADASGTDASGADASGTDASGADASGTDASSADADDVDASSAGASGAGASGTGASGAGVSGAGASGAGVSGAGVSGAGVSGAGAPGTGAPGTVTADNRNAAATYKFDTLELQAVSPGTWGNQITVAVNQTGIVDDQTGVADDKVVERHQVNGKPAAENFFNLILVDGNPNGAREVWNVVSLHKDAGARRLDRVLSQGSNLARVVDKLTDSEKTSPSENGGETRPKTFKDGSDSPYLKKAADFLGSELQRTGLYALHKTDLFNLLCIPPDRRDDDPPEGVLEKAMLLCAEQRAMLIVDPPVAWGTNKAQEATEATKCLKKLNLTGRAARNAAIYFPRLQQADPLRGGQVESFVPCGAIAGLIARTDSNRGVWKAPAGLDATINGITGLDVTLNDADNGRLNPLGINCLRTFPLNGSVVWGARTLRGADLLADEYKYVPVRRLALYLEESLYRGLQWVVFEPNDEPLWAQIRLNAGSFMHDLFRQGAFQGATPREAYLVKCDHETTTQSDINQGIVNIVVGFAPLKPAEFVIIKIQQLAGQLAA